MNRNRFLLAVLALGGLVGAAEVRSNASAQKQRLAEFLTKAQDARAKQKLQDREALVAKYPTPEVEFSQPVDVHVSPAGSEVTLAVTGQFVPESLVLVPCEGVELLSTKVTARRAEARVRVLPGALPYECDMQIVSPVSGISSMTPVMHIKGRYEWDLKLSNGMETRWTTSMGEDGYTLVGQGEWTGKGKSLGKRNVVVHNDGESGVRAEVEITDAEANAAQQVYESSGADMEAFSKKMDALIKKAETECAKVPESEQANCQAKYGPQMQALAQQVMSRGEATQKAAQNVLAVCAELRLKASGGQVTGTAENCGGATGVVNVTGTYKSVASK
jgi:hypothetical protein